MKAKTNMKRSVEKYKELKEKLREEANRLRKEKEKPPKKAS